MPLSVIAPVTLIDTWKPVAAAGMYSVALSVPVVSSQNKNAPLLSVPVRSMSLIYISVIDPAVVELNLTIPDVGSEAVVFDEYWYENPAGKPALPI